MQAMRIRALLLMVITATTAGMGGTVSLDAAPGDEQWSGRFGPLGVLGGAHALAASGSNVYVGGVFPAAGGRFRATLSLEPASGLLLLLFLTSALSRPLMLSGSGFLHGVPPGLPVPQRPEP